MPLAYSNGSVAEHLACRTHAAVFDVSHLGRILLGDHGARDRLQSILTNDLDRVGPGQTQYHLLVDEGGNTLDDVVVWWLPAGERFLVIANAANAATVADRLGGADITEQRALIALQGPRAYEILNRVWPETTPPQRHRVIEGPGGSFIGGTGYTGEPGVEIDIPAELGGSLFVALVEAGATPAGLGARDSLRLEAGLPLFGQDLAAGISPIRAGLLWAVRFDKGPFPGREALMAEAARQPATRLFGLAGRSRRPLRRGQTVTVTVDNEVLRSELTSGGYSPLLTRGIGLVILPRNLTDGTPAEVEVRPGVREPAEVVVGSVLKLARPGPV